MLRRNFMSIIGGAIGCAVAGPLAMAGADVGPTPTLHPDGTFDGGGAWLLLGISYYHQHTGCTWKNTQTGEILDTFEPQYLPLDSINSAVVVGNNFIGVPRQDTPLDIKWMPVKNNRRDVYCNNSYVGWSKP